MAGEDWCVGGVSGHYWSGQTLSYYRSGVWRDERRRVRGHHRCGVYKRSGIAGDDRSDGFGYEWSRIARDDWSSYGSRVRRDQWWTMVGVGVYYGFGENWSCRVAGDEWCGIGWYNWGCSCVGADYRGSRVGSHSWGTQNASVDVDQGSSEDDDLK